MPLIYIILVNYNGHDDTIECVKSLRKIKYKNFKIIIVDNASTDNSLNVLNNSLKDCIIIGSQKNLGFAGGNNIAIKYAIDNNAEYVLLLNNDTIVESDFLDKLLEVSERYSNVGVVGGKINYYSEPNKIWYAGGKINKFTGKTKHIGVNRLDEGQYDKIKITEYITGCMMLINKQVIEKVGLMDESYFLYFEETDWSIRMKNNGFKLIYTPYSKIYHKVSSSTQKISNSAKYYYDRNRYFFVMKNFKIVNRIFMHVYIRINLLLKLLKYKLKRNNERVNVIKNTLYSIKNNIMGEMKL